MSWSLYKDDKLLEPLLFSNNKTQEDIVNEILKNIKEGKKIIFIHGICGTGKSAIALNLAKELGKTSIVVPIKSLQEQYINDYTNNLYILNNQNKKLKISSILGRKNFKCKYLIESSDSNLFKSQYKEKNALLSDIFAGVKPKIESSDKSCNNLYLPCKIEIKEKNTPKIKEYIKKNPNLKNKNFNDIKDVRRMSVAPACPYWSPIMPEEFEINKIIKSEKIIYKGIDNRNYVFNKKTPGCPYYDQYLAYSNSDVIIFNSLKYKLETLMNRKPKTEVEVIDECDDFLDSFANQEKINLRRLAYALNNYSSKKLELIDAINELIDITNTLSLQFKNQENTQIQKVTSSLIEDMFKVINDNPELIDEIATDEYSYLFHLYEVSEKFNEFIDESYFSIEKQEKDLIVNIVTTNLAKKFKELVEKNKIIILMSGTIHSESVLRNIFGLENFIIIDAETKNQGDLVKLKIGVEIDCKYANFKSNKVTREEFLKAFSKSVESSIPPTLIHLTSFSDLPTQDEKDKYYIKNLPTQIELIQEQNLDPRGERVKAFKDHKTDILFTTRCNRGIDFPGDTCNSIIISRFPYPNISNIFWKILKRTHPTHFMNFYMDKAKRELKQKIYRGLRSKSDKVYLLSPDSRVLDFEM